ncbi:MAG: DUF6427 family protein [Flavobacteriales bacterium]|nr:DUF6427 family protein [Flavobacteriales bacterium]
MIVRLFKNNQVAGLIFLLVFQILIYLNALTHSPPSVEPANLPDLYKSFIASWMNDSLVLALGSFVLITLQALLFNYLVVQTGILGKPTYMPAFVFVLICSLLPENLYMNPATLSNIFVLFGLISTWEIARKPVAIPPVFTGAFLLSVGSFIYPPLLFLLVWLLIALGILSNATVKDVAVLLIGFFIPYLYMFTAYFWLSTPEDFLTTFFVKPFGLPDYRLKFRITEYILYAVIVITMGFSFMHYLLTAHFYKMVQKRMFQVLGYLLLTVIIAGAFYNLFQKHHLVLLGFPMSVFLSFYFLQLKKNWIADLIILSIFTLIIILQFDYF